MLAYWIDRLCHKKIVNLAAGDFRKLRVCTERMLRRYIRTHFPQRTRNASLALANLSTHAKSFSNLRGDCEHPFTPTFDSIAIIRRSHIGDGATHCKTSKMLNRLSLNSWSSSTKLHWPMNFQPQTKTGHRLFLTMILTLKRPSTYAERIITALENFYDLLVFANASTIKFRVWYLTMKFLLRICKIAFSHSWIFSHKCKSVRVTWRNLVRLLKGCEEIVVFSSLSFRPRSEFCSAVRVCRSVIFCFKK